MWSQMISSKVVDDTMYLCMGNGGDASSEPQVGVILFGTSKITIAANSAGGDVVTMTMLDSKNDPSLAYNPTMWVQLNAVSIVASNGGRLLLPASPAKYIIDSGTSHLILMDDAYKAFDSTFCGAISGAAGNSSMVATCAAQANSYIITLSGNNLALPTAAQLNSIFPNISFSFSTASSDVNFKPSVYMTYVGTDSTTANSYRYAVFIISSGSRSHGLLGNAWMADWLIQQTISTRQLIMTSVKSCSDISY